MLLIDYIKKNKIKLKDFADASGLSYSLVAKLNIGNRRCSLKAADKIVAVTNGVVTKQEALWPQDFIEHNSDRSIQRRFTINGPAPIEIEEKQNQG